MENYVCRWSIDCFQRFHDYNFSDLKEMQNAMEPLVMLPNPINAFVLLRI